MRWLIFLLVLTSACSVQHKSSMVFQNNQSSSTQLILHPDQTFDYVFSNTAVKGKSLTDNFKLYKTSGQWTKNKDSYLLNSDKNQTKQAAAKIINSAAKTDTTVSVMFLNSFGQIIKPYTAEIADSFTMINIFYTDQQYFVEKKNAVITFYFYGYSPFEMNINKKSEHDYIVILNEEFVPDYFQQQVITKKGKHIYGIGTNNQHLTQVKNRTIDYEEWVQEMRDIEARYNFSVISGNP